MSETLIIESKNSQKNNFNYFLDNFPISEGLQYTSNPTNINRIFDSLFRYKTSLFLQRSYFEKII